MRLKRLAVQNFRSLQSVDIDFPQVCAIVGPNNSGKSNILEALRRVLALEWGPRTAHFSEDNVYFRNPDLDIEIACYFDPPIAYSRLQNADPVQIDQLHFSWNHYKIGPEKGMRKLDQSCLNADGKKPSVMVTYPKKGTQPRFEQLLNIPQSVRESVPLIYIGTNRSLKE